MTTLELWAAVNIFEQANSKEPVWQVRINTNHLLINKWKRISYNDIQQRLQQEARI